MTQQIIALAVIIYFIARLAIQKNKKQISANEFNFWLLFWILAILAVVFLKRIDKLVKLIGFSGSGIDVLIYAGVIILFYFIFRVRLRVERIERDITEIVKNIAVNNKINFK